MSFFHQLASIQPNYILVPSGKKIKLDFSPLSVLFHKVGSTQNFYQFIKVKKGYNRIWILLILQMQDASTV